MAKRIIRLNNETRYIPIERINPNYSIITDKVKVRSYFEFYKYLCVWVFSKVITGSKALDK